MHTVIPAHDLLRLPDHGPDLTFAEGDRPGKGREGIAADVKGQKLPECPGNAAVEIAVHHAGSEPRRSLRAPYDAVEFLPGVAEITPVKVDDHQLAPLDHHIPDVIIPVLIKLRPSVKKGSVLREIVKKRRVAFKLYRTFFISLYLAVDLGVEPCFPIRQILRRIDFG